MINKSKAWFNEKLKEAILKDRKLPTEKHHYKLSRKIIKHTFKLNEFPSFKHISMQLDQKVAKIEKKKEEKAKEFNWWIKLSTLEKGKPINLPVYKNSYFEEKRRKAIQFYPAK